MPAINKWVENIGEGEVVTSVLLILCSSARIMMVTIASALNAYQYVLNSIVVICNASYQPPSVVLSNPIENRFGSESSIVLIVFVPAIAP